ncbi:mechanosensitive ion channel family protein [Xanthobacter sp. TB0139]|uniref:mechanosensitive ion channel family protein n=1 Tax=Xanthobacter sp. TB0139 TaxID=3459178 RepID=UPI004039060C
MRFISGVLALLALLLALPAQAQTTGPLEPINRSSPSETYNSFLATAKRLEHGYADYVQDKSPAKVKAMQRDLRRIRQLMDLSTLPHATQAKTGNAAAGYLYDILARLPAPAPDSIPGAIPGEDKLPEKWTIPGTDIQIARAQNGPRAGDYLITAESISNIPEYYFSIIDSPVLQKRIYPYLHREQVSATGPLIPDSLTQNIPDQLKVYHLNSPLWKILAIGVVILLTLVLSLLWTRVARKLARTGGAIRQCWWKLTMPLVFLGLFSLSEWFIFSQINPAGMMAAGESLFATFIFYTAGAWAVWLACFLMIAILIHSPHLPENSNNATLIRLTGRICALLLAGGILAYGANEMGIPALGLVAGLGVGGFALALSSQSTIENLFGGLSLFADKPLRIGDYIEFGEEVASVENIGPRSTRLRALSGVLYTVPNADIAKMPIVNYTMREKCFLKQDIAVRGDTPPEKLRALQDRLLAMLIAEEIVEKDTGWPRARIDTIGYGRINIQLRAIIETSEYYVFLAWQEQIILATLEHMRELGVELAQPLPDLRNMQAP